MRAWFEGRPPDETLEHVREWERRVVERLNEYLDHPYATRFRSDVGLTPPPAPSSLTDARYVDAWRDLQMRLLRLQEIIDELRIKWKL
jgi:hypothetical protein